MKLSDAIAGGTEFAPWMEGDRPPATVLVAPPGTQPSDLVPGLRAALEKDGIRPCFVAVESGAADIGPPANAVIVTGALLPSVGACMRVPGAVAIVPHDDVEAVHRSLRDTSLKMQSSRGFPVRGVDPDIQYACDRVQIIAPLGADGTEVVAGGLFFRSGLDGEPMPYVPGNPYRPAPPRQPEPSAPEPDPEPLVVDLDRLASLVEASLLPTFLMDWQEADGPDLPVINGTGPQAFIPSGTEWPSSGGHPLSIVIHLTVPDLPPPARDLLGGRGLFQLFVALDGSPDYAEGWLARIVDPDGPGDWTDAPAGCETLPGRVVTGWRERRDHAFQEDEEIPGCDGLSGDELAAIELVTASLHGQHRIPGGEVAAAAARFSLDPARLERLASLVAHHDRDKLLGWPTWVQGADWPAEGGMVLLLQLCFDSDDAIAPCLIAGDGSLQVLVSTDGERRFAFRWACG